MVERCDIKLTLFCIIMLLEPTYTRRQYWLTVLTTGIVFGVLSSAVYYIFYWFLYVQQSYFFSIIYLIPLLGSTVGLFFFKHKYTWNEFSYKNAFLMSFVIGTISDLILSIFLFIAYTFLIETRIDLYENFDNDTLQRFMSPLAVSLSMLIINIILSLFYSLIIAIFAKRKIEE